MPSGGGSTAQLRADQAPACADRILVSQATNAARLVFKQGPQAVNPVPRAAPQPAAGSRCPGTHRMSIMARCRHTWLPMSHPGCRRCWRTCLPPFAIAHRFLRPPRRPAMESVDALVTACRSGDAAAVERILAAAPAAVMSADARGFLPLHIAAEEGHEAAVVRLLLQAAPAAATSGGRARELPLHLAAMRGHVAMARLLLEAAPATAMAAGAGGFLPLHCAAGYGHEAVARLLLQAAPSAAAAGNVLGWLPLHFALMSDNTSTARALLGVGPPELVLTALAARIRYCSLFADFLLAPGRLPLDAASWALVPVPCVGIDRALPIALACSPAQAAQLVRRLPPADAARLRTAALCLGRSSLPGPVAGHILARMFC